MKKFYFFIFLLTSLTFKVISSFSQSGILDASFGNGGKVVTPTGLSNSIANAVAITPDGKILAGGTELDNKAGYVLNNGNLLQYNSEGTLDSAFGINGKISSASVALTTVYAIAI